MGAMGCDPLPGGEGEGTSPAGAAVLAAIVRAPQAWADPAALAAEIWPAAAAAARLDATCDQLAELELAGLVEAWDGVGCGGGPVVTLSAYGAVRLGVHLVEHGRAEVPRWAPVGDPVPAPRLGRYRAAGGADLPGLEVADDRPGPATAAALAEAAAAVARARPAPLRRHEVLPYPAHLLGDDGPAWAGPLAPGEDCPCCGGRPLPPAAYCLRCDRWGLDPRVPRPPRRPPAAPDPGALAALARAQKAARKRSRRERLRAS